MNIFQQISDYVKREYSTFKMDNNWCGSINGFGSLNRIYSSIVLPSDTWKLGHNILVKLPALISPAFTRIKGIVNSYYCSYASVWNYWNSFISDKPEDVFLSRSLTAAYKGKFVEPCVPMMYIAFICKVARGYFNSIVSDSRCYTQGFDSGANNFLLTISTLYHTNMSSGSETDFIPSPSTLTWSVDSSQRRKLVVTPNISNVGSSYQFNYDYSSAYSFTFPIYPEDSQTPNSSAQLNGFSTVFDWFVYQCQQVERNLSNSGVPTDMLAQSPISYYDRQYFNCLNFMCDSSIWHNFYRDEQNQSPEFDYREVNGAITNVNPFNSSTHNIAAGWHLRLLGIPPNVTTGSDYWFKISTAEQALSVLTGFLLEDCVRYYCYSFNSSTNISILPKSYNGLLVLKYRNFEKDYFTSACVDPNFGGVSVQVPSTIDALRTASKLEEFLEVSASARDFYNFMKHIFGTNPESTRYSKPLLLGTQVVPIQIGEQLQTSQTTTGVNGSPLGDRAGVADGYGNSGTVNHYFNEHGYLVSYLSFVLDSQYMQGMPHELMHHLQLDYPFPQFANLGAESIPLSEIYYGVPIGETGVDYDTGDNNAVVTTPYGTYFERSRVDPQDVTNVAPGDSTPVGLDIRYGEPGSSEYPAYVDTRTTSGSIFRDVFGYTPRYSKWKFKQDVVAGQMRDSLEFWHTFRQFSQVPYISNNFVSYMNAGFLSNLNRIFAVVNDNADKFVCDIFNNGSVRRCLPLVPQTTID